MTSASACAAGGLSLSRWCDPRFERLAVAPSRPRSFFAPACGLHMPFDGGFEIEEPTPPVTIPSSVT
eukprot:1902294-Prymnesium_polylepis.1